MISAVVDPQSGELATEWCPTRTRQWYKPGNQPTEECQLHIGPPQGPIAIDANGNIQINTPDPIKSAGRTIGNILRRIIHW